LSYLFISLDVTVVRAITDRVMVMMAGEFGAEGPTFMVLSSPQNPYTRELIGAARVRDIAG
jgi:peptide/nickel transport system ATP-binding protein